MNASRLSLIFVRFIVGVAWWLVACGGEPREGDPEAVATVTHALLAAGSLDREGENSDVVATLVDSAALESLDTRNVKGQFVTAYKNGSGGLTVRLWELHDDGTIEKHGSFTDSSTIDRVAVVALGQQNLVVVTRSGGNLHLKSFVVSSTNDIQLQDTDSAGSVQEFAASRVYHAQSNKFQLATVVKITNGIKVIAWNVSSTTGTITRGSSDGSAGSVLKVSAAAPVQPLGVLLTPLILPGTSLKVIAWKITEGGAVTRGGSHESSNVGHQEVSATTLSYGRIAVATLQTLAAIRAFDVSEDAQEVTAGDTNTLSPTLSSMDITNDGGSRLFVAGKDSSNNLSVQSFEAIDDFKNIDRIAAGTASGQSIVALKAHRVITPVITGGGTQKVIAWRDYSMPLLRGEWPYTLGDPVPPIPPTPPVNNVSTFDFPPFFALTYDLMIAASPKFVVAGGTGSVTFFDKAGNRLGQKTANVGTEVWYDDLFAPIVDFDKPDGSPNEHSLLRHLEFQHACDPTLPFGIVKADDNWCSNEFYDSRALYSEQLNRFILLTHLRSSTGNSHMRHVLFAVSKTEDPRDGFYLFGHTESVSRDDPKVAAGGGMLIVTHSETDNREPLRPSVFLYDLAALAADAAHIPVSKLTLAQTGVGNNVPLHYGAGNAAIVMDRVPGAIRAFEKDLVGPVDVREASVEVPEPLNEGAITMVATLRGMNLKPDGSFAGGLYLSTVTDEKPRDVKLTKVFIAFKPGMEVVTSLARPPGCSSDTCAHQIIPVEGVAEGCLRPSVGVDGTGRVLINYMHDPVVNTRAAAYVTIPEFGSTNLVYGTLQESLGTLLIGGNPCSVSTDCQFGLSCSGGTCTNQYSQFNNTVPDTATGGGFWMMQNYSKSTGFYGVVAGRVVP